MFDGFFPHFQKKAANIDSCWAMQSSPSKKNKTLPGLEAPIPLEAV